MDFSFSLTQPYNFKAVEAKWQKFWQENSSFEVQESSEKEPFYVLEMFPYPSGTLHMGHARNYAIGDVLARYRWAKGYEVLHPMGWDACGLPAENAALKNGIHPRIWTYENARIMKEQCQALGFSHQWSREIFSCDPAYFVHEQGMFLAFYENGLAYQKEAYVNWDPEEHSVLANEQVVDGRGWRSGALVEKRLLKQWFLRITEFASELLEDLKGLTHWPESVRRAQENWIGKSQGVLIDLPVVQNEIQELQRGACLEIYTTRPETIFGMTFAAIAWDHPLAQTQGEKNHELGEFLQQLQKGSTATADIETQEKKGMAIGLWACNPLNPSQKVPIYAVNYVKSDYGSGAVMGVPSHDERDAEFAGTYGLPFVSVINDSGIMMHSGPLDTLTVAQGRLRIAELLHAMGKGREKTLYRLRDWGIGRQRYWGVPIPIIHCPSCGAVPVPKEQLPVILPEDVVFSGKGNPLEAHPEWKHVPCPRCRRPAQRECDTFDTFFESSWYFARFCDPFNPEQAFAQRKAEKWLPVNQYVGGIEHAVLHLLYARFFTKALARCGYWSLSEPFHALFTQGMVCHKTFKDFSGQWVYPRDVCADTGRHLTSGEKIQVGRSEKMSKSKCNVVDVGVMIESYGADAVRLFLLSDTPAQKDLEWSDEGIEGAWRYVRRLWTLCSKLIIFLQSHPVDSVEENFHTLPRNEIIAHSQRVGETPSAGELTRITAKTAQAVASAIESYGLNKAIALIREFSNFLSDYPLRSCAGEKQAIQDALEVLVCLIAPFMPHLAEEVAFCLGWSGNVHRRPWPILVVEQEKPAPVTLAVQINGKMRATIVLPFNSGQEEIQRALQVDAKIQQYLQGKTIQRLIIVPNRMISIVC